MYQEYLNALILQGKSPKTVDMYSRYLRQISLFFDTCPDALTAAELKGYFLKLVETKKTQLYMVCQYMPITMKEIP